MYRQADYWPSAFYLLELTSFKSNGWGEITSV